MNYTGITVFRIIITQLKIIINLYSSQYMRLCTYVLVYEYNYIDIAKAERVK